MSGSRHPTQGFETAIAAPNSQPYVRVQALSASGTLLRSSPVIKSWPHRRSPKARPTPRGGPSAVASHAIAHAARRGDNL